MYIIHVMFIILFAIYFLFGIRNEHTYLQMTCFSSFQGKHPLHGKQKKWKMYFSLTIAHQIPSLQFARNDLESFPDFLTLKEREADFIHY